MAEEKKPELNVDDWDSLPLDPDADDWDDGPAAAPPGQASQDDFDTPPPDPAPAGKDDFDAPPPDPAPAGEDDFDAPLPGPAPAGEDDFDAPPPGPVPAADFEPPAAPKKAKPPDFDSEANDLDTGFGSQDIDAAFASLTSKSPEPPAKEDIDATLPADESLTTKKVELDIDGIFLDDLEGPSLGPLEGHQDEAEPPTAAPEGETPAAKAQPEEAPAVPTRRRVPKPKLLILIGLAALVFLMIVFGAYMLFFASPPPPPAPPPLVIDPQVTAPEPVPGDVALEPFYINFPGNFGETIVEMTVTLSYTDQPDLIVINEKMTQLRDLIFRITQNKGSEAVSSGEIQRALRQELTDQANELLGGQRISYIQLNQIRILQ